ncbi:MAG: alpha/beta hydrolase [Pseudomonadota bacterium]
MTERREPNSVKIVVLPGLDGMAELRAEFCSRLSCDLEAVVMEYPVNLVRYDDLLNWIEGKLPAQDYIVVAESFSGPLAIELAAAKPAHLKGLVFVATFAKAPRTLPAAVLRLLDLVPFHLKAFSVMAQPLMMGRWRNRVFTNLFHDNNKAVPARTIRGRIRELLGVDCTAKLSMIDVPYIYIGASKDLPVPLRAADDFRAGAQSVRLVEGPHFLLQAQAKTVAEHVMAFVTSLPQRRMRAL